MGRFIAWSEWIWGCYIWMVFALCVFGRAESGRLAGRGMRSTVRGGAVVSSHQSADAAASPALRRPSDDLLRAAPPSTARFSGGASLPSFLPLPPRGALSNIQQPLLSSAPAVPSVVIDQIMASRPRGSEPSVRNPPRNPDPQELFVGPKECSRM
jgi:hypothetical protein